jgi:hypothetical protein
MIGCIDHSEHQLYQLHCLIMIQLQVFLEYSFKCSLYEVEKVIFGPTAQVPQTIQNALPNRVFLQGHEVILY